MNALGWSAALVVTYAVQYGLGLLSWMVLGAAVLDGRVGAGTVAGWATLLLGSLAARVIGGLLQGRLAVVAGVRLRQRLIRGLRRLDPASVRRVGRGRVFGHALETENIEDFLAGAAASGVAATVELLLATVILTGAIGPAALVPLVGWLAATAAVAGRYLHHRTLWTSARLDLGTDLAERLAGQRTQAVQDGPVGTAPAPDESAPATDGSAPASVGSAPAPGGAASVAVARYDLVARAADRWLVRLGRLPRAWTLAGLGAVACTAGDLSRADLAAAALGLLAGSAAATRVVAGLAGAVHAWSAWALLRPLLPPRSAAPDPDPDIVGGPGGPDQGAADRLALVPGRTVIEARGLGLRRPGRAAPILSDVDLTIAAGDRILIEGPSGGGKSTLAALLSAQRTPSTGTVRLDGRTLDEVGERGWRSAVLAVPQAEHNHLILAPLAMNLLLGRGWPARPEDLHDAERVCRALGLGDLIDRMPCGLAQPVGETGWPLSQGERDLVFLARALLRDPAVLVLDETFGALDPPTLRTAVEVTRDRAATLVVIRQ